MEIADRSQHPDKWSPCEPTRKMTVMSFTVGGVCSALLNEHGFFLNMAWRHGIHKPSLVTLFKANDGHRLAGIAFAICVHTHACSMFHTRWLTTRQESEPLFA